MAARTVLTGVGTHGLPLLPAEGGGPDQNGAGASHLEGGGSGRGVPEGESIISFRGLAIISPSHK